MKPITFHSEGRQELDEAVAHHEQLAQRLGLALEDEVEAATRLIQQNPAIGAIYKNTPLRYFVIRRFP